jgi:hypothetical protein
VLLRFEKIEERLPDLRGRHHLKRAESLMKKFRAGERKFSAASGKTTFRDLSTAGGKIFLKIFLEHFCAREDNWVRS